jgi:TP901 family phage tail tape measure protein
VSNLLGTVSGQFKVDVSQAVAAYASARTANEATMTAMSRSSKVIGDLSNMFLGVGIAIAGALGYAADQAGKFNAEMDYFQAVSKATTTQMDAVRAKAIQLDQTTMFSTEDIAQMFTQLAKSGESVNQILGGVADAATNLAQAAQVPLTNATKDLVTAMSAFNLTAKDAAMVANEFSGASNNSIISVDDLATSFRYVGAVASNLGISIQSTTTALTLMGRAGIQGSMGGTELRQMLLQISAPTKAATTEMKSLGIITKSGANQFFDASGKAKDLSQIFQILQNSMKNMTVEQQTAALKTLFNSRAMAGAVILTKAGAKGFDQMNAAINKTTAADVARKRMDNLQGSLHILTSSLKTMAITAGQPLQNFLNGVVKGITALVQGFTHLSPQTQSLIIHIIAIVGALALFLGIVGKFISMGLMMWKTIKDLGMAFQFLFGIGKSLITMVRSLTVALLENPIALIVVAVIALAAGFYLLYQHSKTFRDIIDSIGRAFKTGFEATINWFKKVPQYFEDALHAIEHVFDVTLNWIKQHWMLIVGFIVDPIGTIMKLLWDKFGGQITAFFEKMWTDAVEGMKHFGEAILTELGKLPDQIAYWLGFALGRLIRWQIDLATWAIKAFNDLMIAIVGFFEKLPGRVEDIAMDLYHRWVNFQLRLKADAMKWGADLINGIVNFFEQLPGRIEKFASDIYTKWINFQVQMKNDAMKWGSDFLNAILGFFQRLPGDIGNWLVSAFNNVVQFGQNVTNKAVQIGQNIVNGIINWVSQLPGLMANIITNVINTIEGWVTSAFQAAENLAGSLWSGFKKGLGINSPSFIEKQMTQITACMDTETQNINRYVKQIQGLGTQLQGNNPMLHAANYSAMTASQMQANMNAQLRQMNVSGAVSVPGYANSSTSAYGNGGMGGQPTKVLEVNVFNPVAENSASSTTKQLQTLAQLGAF